MTNQAVPATAPPGRTPAADLAPSQPSAARMWNHWLGGTHNYAVDRAAGDRLAAANPGLVERVRTTRHFLDRAVRHLAHEAGVRQFLDIGPGLPAAGSTHQIAQRAAPDARVVYADNDPVTVGHARTILAPSPPGAVTYLQADLRSPEALLEAVSGTLDLNRPVALVLSGILGHVPTYEEARATVRTLMAQLPSGSHLLAHDISDTESDWRAVQARHNADAPVAYHLRTPRQIAGYFDGLRLVDPGVVPLTDWRPDAESPASAEWAALVADVVGGVGHKP
ncbi:MULTISPECIES: SAM-dependent methyltransferase [unclassified Streptomyces]|uniref:SAM-dependent methyltransferase n=1 Tax=unclassified Streptomyces TaxID=2593676 RepID=UPI00278C3F26|nr:MULTISPECIES: SAM-dependent methyltransferase [unclassified Streptomyces]